MVKSIVRQYIDLLYQKQLVTDKQYQDLLARDFPNLADAEKYVRQLVVITDDDAGKIKAELYNLEYVNLVGKSVSSGLLNLIPRDVAETYKITVFDLSLIHI